MRLLHYICLPAASLISCTGATAQDVIKSTAGDLVIQPVKHASFLLSWAGKTIYVDPAWDKALYEGYRRPDLILVTDIHRDHFDAAVLEAITGPATLIVAPAAVRDQLPASLHNHVIAIANGETTDAIGIRIETIPMYNLTQDRLRFHPKGRGNGYVLTIGDRRIYVAGDTEDTPEMRSLHNIDVAFLPMNIPYTMTVEQAAAAVEAFRPKIVIPYHYGQSDTGKFAELVEPISGVEVWLRDWKEEGAK